MRTLLPLGHALGPRLVLTAALVRLFCTSARIAKEEERADKGESAECAIGVHHDLSMFDTSTAVHFRAAVDIECQRYDIHR